MLKTRAQVRIYQTMSYREEIAKIYQNEGLMGFTRGYTGMLLRDTPGFGLYFCLYEFFKRSLHIPQIEERIRKQENTHSATFISLEASLFIRKFFSGGTAGVVTWFVCYPFDTVKTKMQNHQGTDRLHLRAVILDVVRTTGVRTLYRGIHV